MRLSNAEEIVEQLSAQPVASVLFALYMAYLHDVSSSDYILSNGRMISESWIYIYVERSFSGLIYDDISKFS